MAIAFDAASDGGLTTSSFTLTWSHVNAGDMLFVACFGGGLGGATGNDDISSVTYNLVFMNLAGKIQTPGDRWVYLFYLPSPAIGTHDVVVTNPDQVISGQACSYSGTAQASTNWRIVTGTQGAATSFPLNGTTLADDCWALMVAKNTIGLASAGSGTTQRESTASGIGMFDSNGSVGASGTNETLTVTGASAAWGGVFVAFDPVAATDTLMGQAIF